MKLCLRSALLVTCLVGWTVTQELDLGDALGDLDDVVPTKPPVEKPKVDAGGGGGELDLLDAFGPDEPEKPKKPAAGDNDNGLGGGFDLADALGPDPNPKPDPPVVNPPPKNGGGGGGSFDDSDLIGVGEGDYKPDGGRSGGRAVDPPADKPAGDQPQAEAGSGQIAGIVSAVGVAILGAASSYFAYQKKKLCFKLQGGVDPESGKGHQGQQSDPQVMSNLLQSSS